MKRATQLRFFCLLLTLACASGAFARQQPPPAAIATNQAGPWDWLENALTMTQPTAPLTVADSSVIGVWQLKPEGGPAAARSVVRQYTSRQDGFLGMVEITIDEQTVPRFKLYSAKAGAPGPLYTDETFSRFLMNGTKAETAASVLLRDRNSLAVTETAAGKTARQSVLTVSTDGGTLTEVSDVLDGSGNAEKKTLVFSKVTTTLDPARLPPAAQAASGSNPPATATTGGPFNPLIGTWSLNEGKSTLKPEAGSVTLHRFIDLGRGAFAALWVRLTRAGIPSMEMAAVKFEGPDDLVLALTIYTLPQMQIAIERESLPANAVAYKMLDARTVQITAKSLANGKTSAITTRRFTEDFMEFTETRQALDAQGKPAGETVTVYNKVAP